MTRKKLKVILGARAEQDLANIATWTVENFGPRQADAYIDAILDAADELSSPSAPVRSKARDEIAPGLRTLHMAQPGRRGRHLILYRTNDGDVIILRFLHDSMEVSAHLPDADK